MVGKVLKMTLAGNSPIRFSLWPDPERLRWVRQWVANCTAQRFPGNKARMQRVAHYSLDELRTLAADTGLADFDFHGDGTLQLFRTPEELELGRLAARTLESLAIPYRLLGPGEAQAVEPAIGASAVRWTGGLHMPMDASGDSHKFCRLLADWLAARGVRFRWGLPVKSIEVQAGAFAAVRAGADGQERLAADACVVALGSFAPALLRPLGLQLPVYPLKGYSITVPVTDAAAAPTVAIMDEHNKIMVSRLGERLRVAGMAELVGHDLSRPGDRRRLLVGLTRELFPHGIDYDRAEFWAGLRPMTPDGPPILGPTRIAGLHLNAGHGSNGWTQACGTSHVVADLLAGRTPGIDTEGLTGARYGLAAA
jgi:D-amino-acid dehydrogenase